MAQVLLLAFLLLCCAARPCLGTPCSRTPAAFGLLSSLRRNRRNRQGNQQTNSPQKSSSFEPTTTLLNTSDNLPSDDDDGDGGVRPMRKRVTRLAKNLVRAAKPPVILPQAVAAVLKDATFQAVDLAVDEVVTRRRRQNSSSATKTGPKSTVDEDDASSLIDAAAVIDQAFQPLEESLQELETALGVARSKMEQSKVLALDTIQAVQAASIAQAEGAQAAISAAGRAATVEVIQDLYQDQLNVTDLAFEDVGYDTSEMAPPFLDEDSCLVPGEPVVRVEKAPENSRRIFAGIDIMASVDTVWELLTDYANLQRVVPSLVVNDVAELYDERSMEGLQLEGLSELEQCAVIAKCHKGSLLKQVGGAKVAGIQFSARTTLEVREWPQGLPDLMHLEQDMYEGKSRQERARENRKIPLQRFKFPRPFSLSKLPTKDISMQSIVDDDGEFRMYQGVWRMQPLPGCGPPGVEYMRLTYAVEVSPRAYLPVSLVEGRIVRDLCTNLEAIRDFVQTG